MTKKRKATKAENKNSYQKKIDELESKVTESNEKYIRLLAEWENYRKRTTKEKSMSIEYGKELIISKVLSVLDDFNRALKAGEKDKKKDGFLLINQKLSDILSKEGLKKISISPGEKFDVNQHEAISQIPTEKKDLKGKIVEEIEPGYILNEKIIRFTKVVIGK